MIRNITDSKYSTLREKDLKDLYLLASQSQAQVDAAIELSLSGTEPDLSRRLFEWAAEIADVPDEVRNKFVEQKRFVYVAQAYLWRGFALLVQGKFAEACSLFNEAMFFTPKYQSCIGLSKSEAINDR